MNNFIEADEYLNDLIHLSDNIAFCDKMLRTDLSDKYVVTDGISVMGYNGEQNALYSFDFIVYSWAAVVGVVDGLNAKNKSFKWVSVELEGYLRAYRENCVHLIQNQYFDEDGFLYDNEDENEDYYDIF